MKKYANNILNTNGYILREKRQQQVLDSLQN